MLFLQLSTVWAVFLATLGATLTTKRQSELPRLSLPVTTVASLSENDTFLENVAMRSNGDLLVTMLQPNATLHLLKPTNHDANLQPIHTFPNATGLVGITDIGPDTFILTAQEYVGFLDPVPNTTTMWEVKFPRIDSDHFTVRKITTLPAVGMFNGMDLIPPSTSCKPTAAHILVGDSAKGQLVRLDTSSGAYEVVLDIPELHAFDGAPFQSGVNGVKIYGDYVYWTNTVRLAFYRIAIDSKGYPVAGATVEVVMEMPDLGALDDFSFDEQGNIWAAASGDNEVFVVRRDFNTKDGYGSVQFVAGGLHSADIPGPTSNIFSKWDNHTLYALTTGGTVGKINGTFVEPAKVVSIDVSGFYEQ